tara:strand:- start:10834 stop:11661 length:828 start_codon:yes stop_codon:yes gene_type:complete
MQAFKDHELFKRVCEDVDGNRQGDAKILIDSRDSRTGSAKTTCAIQLAYLFAEHFDYELQLEDFTLSHRAYLNRYQREHPGKEQVSILVHDELSGSGSGDARRFMSNKNVNFARALETSRVRRVITLFTTPNFGFVDKKIRLLADYRIACNPRPLGTGRAYKVGNTFASGELRLRRLPGNIAWDALPEDDPYYEHLNKQKDKLNRSRLYSFDEIDGEKKPLDPKEIVRDEKVAMILRMQEQGMSHRKIAPLIGISRSTVSDWITKYGPDARQTTK